MAEYIKKSDVLAYPIRRDNYDKVNGNEHFINGVESIMEYVEGLPAADVVPGVHILDGGCTWYALQIVLIPSKCLEV